MTQDLIVYGLIRFGPRNCLEEFCDSGRIYMNALRYFKPFENGDTLRGDKSEGLLASFPARRVSLSVKKEGGVVPIKGLINQFQIGDPRDEFTKIFSLTAITNRNETDLFDDRLIGFGDSVALILDGDEFLRRVRKAFEARGLLCRHGLVEYINKHTYTGETGPFRKYSDLEFQSECRIATQTNFPGPVSDLSIGSIRDISELGESKTLRQRIRIQKQDD